MKRQQQQAQGIKIPSEKNLLSAHPSSSPMTSASESAPRCRDALCPSIADLSINAGIAVMRQDRNSDSFRRLAGLNAMTARKDFGCLPDCRLDVGLAQSLDEDLVDEAHEAPLQAIGIWRIGINPVDRCATTRNCTKRVTSSRISSPNSSNSGPSPPAMTSALSTSWQEFTSHRSSFGLIEDRP